MTTQVPAKIVDRAVLDRADYATPAAFSKARAAAWSKLIRTGMTITDVGVAAGLSRERVRQVLRKEGYQDRLGATGTPRPVDPKRVVAALRDGESRGVRGLARLSGCSEREMGRALQELGLWAAAKRSWRRHLRDLTRREGGTSREAMIKSLQEFHARFGRTPAIGDALAGLLPFGKTTFIRRFGRWNKALAAAGLETRSPARSKGKRTRSK